MAAISRQLICKLIVATEELRSRSSAREMISPHLDCLSWTFFSGGIIFLQLKIYALLANARDLCCCSQTERDQMKYVCKSVMSRKFLVESAKDVLRGREFINMVKWIFTRDRASHFFSLSQKGSIKIIIYAQIRRQIRFAYPRREEEWSLFIFNINILSSLFLSRMRLDWNRIRLGGNLNR